MERVSSEDRAKESGSLRDINCGEEVTEGLLWSAIRGTRDDRRRLGMGAVVFESFTGASSSRRPSACINVVAGLDSLGCFTSGDSERVDFASDA